MAARPAYCYGCRYPGLSRQAQTRPNRFTTQRREADEVKILSGVFEDERTDGPRTTGTPIMLMIENIDQRSKDYGEIRDTYRPGHADFTYDAKYGIRDYRGGGRSSARETAARVAAGAVARKVIPECQHPRRAGANGPAQDRSQELGLGGSRQQSVFLSRCQGCAKHWEEYLDGIRKSGSSCGAVIEVTASGVPAGWGAPLYAKLDQELAAAMMSINAVKGVEIGAWLCLGSTYRRSTTPTKSACATASPNFYPITPAAFSAASPPGRMWWCVLP